MQASYTTATNTGLAPPTYGPAGTAYSYAAPSLLQPEVIDAYEVGAKSQWFGNRLLVDVAVFDNQINNAVTNVTTPVVNLAVPSGVSNGVVFRNAGAAYARGGELEVQAVPIENWHVSGILGFLRTRYTSQNSPTYDLLETQFPRSPKVNAQGATSYDEALPWGGSIRWAADANWRSGFWFYPNTCYQFGAGCSTGNSGPDYDLHENGYVIANVHLSWFPADNRKLAFQIDVLNASDTHYHTHALAGKTTGTVTYFNAAPISVFGSVAYKF